MPSDHPTLTPAALVERVARAICIPMGGADDYDARPAGERIFMRRMARAALAAVAEAAKWDGAGVVEGNVRGTDYPTITLHFPEHDYEAMQEAAALLRALAEVGEARDG